MKKKPSLAMQTALALKKARQDAGFTMAGVAKELSISRQMVTQWESGKENLTLETIERYCDAIGIEPFFSFK